MGNAKIYNKTSNYNYTYLDAIILTNTFSHTYNIFYNFLLLVPSKNKPIIEFREITSIAKRKYPHYRSPFILLIILEL